MRTALRALLLAGALAAATWAFGWWSVPIVAAIWGWIAASLRRPVLVAGAAAATAWGALLVWSWASATASTAALATALAGAMRVPSAVLVLLTLLFPALLAICAAQLTVSARRQFI